MKFLKTFISGVLMLLLSSCRAAQEQAKPVPFSDEQTLWMQSPGAHRLTILSPTCLELSLVTRKDPDPAPFPQWNFVTGTNQVRLPAASEFQVITGGTNVSVAKVGFKRSVLYAPFKVRDLRVLNSLYIILASPVQEGAVVEVKSSNHEVITDAMHFTNRLDRARSSPVLHVNQTGYLASEAKTAMLGYYLGSLGELNTQDLPGKFELIEIKSGKPAFSGGLKPRKDVGYDFPCYQSVLEADFSAFNKPGEYQLEIPGLGRSVPFWINDAVAGAFARTYALGIYHQRCGAANELPYTRFIHGVCHTKPAAVPTTAEEYAAANASLAKESANFKDNPRHTARQLKDFRASLYPFVNKGPLDVSGGHHDAGDYSKYTINSAGFIHHLAFALDNFPGVRDLDNLGLPESGDGKSDIAQEIKWEADFLVKMQDGDGGFYFLVYPKDREYEIDVLPDKGDPQIVFPKTTAATAAAVAALAQCASSPVFKEQFPEAAALYLNRARAGWKFLEQAIAKHGKDGSYQKITHYGDEYMHDDELAWAAVELFIATGEARYKEKAETWLNPADPEIRKWGWWRLFDAYGCAIRSYAFAVRSGKMKAEGVNPLLLQQCEAEVASAGDDQLKRSENCAYGTSFPEETKHFRNAGWYFSMDAAFDLAVAYQLDQPVKNDLRPRIMRAILANVNYEQGCNPVNVTYLTGLGSKRQREIVHQYAQNDRRVLPPTGIPLGNIQAGFMWLDTYKQELGTVTFPSSGDEQNPYPFYDRWADGFNLSQEFVILNQARALGCLSWLMARTNLKSQAWKPISGTIETASNSPGKGAPTHTFKLSAPGVDLSDAKTIWEASGMEPIVGENLPWGTAAVPKWVEAEATLSDGRRVMAITEGAALSKLWKVR
jgi:hypothetical protein